MPARWTRVLPAALALAAASLPGLSLAACSSSKSEAKPSPFPPGFSYANVKRADPPPSDEDAGKDLDAVLAVVESQPITRRRLIRESGGRPSGVEDEVFERQIHQRLKDRVKEELFLREAKRSGITMPPRYLDEIVAEQTARMVKDASKSEGRPVTIAEVLTDRGITPEEFRDGLERRGYYEIYLRRLTEGIGPIRPQVGMEVSPAEVRRIYRAQPKAFDLARATSFVAFALRLDRYMEGDRSFEEAEATSRRDAAAIADAWRKGEEPEDVARRFGLSKERGDFMVVPEKREEGDPTIRAGFGDDGAAWIWAPERRPRDAMVFDKPQGPVVVGILEVQEPQQRDWEAVRTEIVEMVRRARRIRVEANLLIQILAQQDIVHPPALASEIVEDARETLERLRKDPVLGAARFQ